MKMTRLFVLIIGAACLLACMPGVSASGNEDITIAQPSGDHAITMDQAKESIRVFLNETNPGPTFLRDEKTSDGKYYAFATKNSIFLVNADNGAVEMVRFFDKVPKSPTEMKVDRDAAYAKAVEYASQKSQGFGERSWARIAYKLDGPEDGAWGYVFNFNEEIRLGNDTVLIPNMVQVSVNPETGEIFGYQSMNRTPIDGVN